MIAPMRVTLEINPDTLSVDATVNCDRVDVAPELAERILRHVAFAYDFAGKRPVLVWVEGSNEASAVS
jgi:hypothetical protein